MNKIVLYNIANYKKIYNNNIKNISTKRLSKSIPNASALLKNKSIIKGNNKSIKIRANKDKIDYLYEKYNKKYNNLIQNIKNKLQNNSVETGINNKKYYNLYPSSKYYYNKYKKKINTFKYYLLIKNKKYN